MAATAQCKLICTCDGLGKLLEFAETWLTTSTPTAFTYNYRTLAVASTAEALDLGDITYVDLIVIKAINSIYIDTTYVAPTFSKEITLHAGEVAVFKPYGTVWIVNYDSSSTTPVYEFLIAGRT